MCGIAGIVSFAGAPPPEDLARMSACIRHRGPDAEGVIHAAGRGGAFAALAHRRLAVLDPDPRSNQPFTADYRGRRAHLTFNGEIYNFRELRTRLETDLPGFPWRTTGDTEVVLAAYLAWGDQCVNDLLGMFALAVFDEADGSLLLARDRMGEKPLYVAVGGGSNAVPGSAIAFASELASVAALAWPDKTVNESALSDYLCYGYIPAPLTIYAGIQKLPPATTRRYRAGSNAKSITYFSPNERIEVPGRPEAAVLWIQSAVREAVRSQLVSDVPLGCFLSGGIDSSITTLCAQRALQQGAGGDTAKKLLTFTARFEDPRYDESRYAEEVAAHLGTTHHTFTVQPNAADDLPLLAASYGEPFADSSALPSYYLAKETRNHVKVALSGDGGDELFAGYDRYRAMALAGRLTPVRRALPKLKSSGHPKSRRARLARFLEGARLTAPDRYELFMRLFPPGMLGAPDLTGAVAGHAFAGEGTQGLEGQSDVDAALALDRLTYLPDDLLTKVDRASMRVALEVRCPFMDHRLVAQAASIPAALHLAHGKKSLLKAAFARDLPPSVFSRKKQGFAVPIGDWFRSSLRGMLRDLLLSPTSFCVGRWTRPSIEALVTDHETRTADHSQRLYALLMLELWAQGTR